MVLALIGTNSTYISLPCNLCADKHSNNILGLMLAVLAVADCQLPTIPRKRDELLESADWSHLGRVPP